MCLSTIPPVSLYRCETCSSDLEKGSTPEIFCEICVFPHIRKQHSVIDSKGKEPFACPQHALPCLEYCHTCDVPLCCKCLTKHSQHTFQPMEEKAAIVKAQVFETLTSLELKEKPLRLKKEAMSNTVQQNLDEGEALSRNLEHECKNLQESLVPEIKNTSKVNYERNRKLANFCEKLNNTQQRVRDLLSQSNAELIQNYKTVLQEVETYDKTHEESMLIQDRNTELLSNESLVQMFNRFKLDLISRISISQKLTYFNVAGRSRETLYRVCDLGLGRIKVLYIEESECSNKSIVSAERNYTLSENNCVTHVFPIYLVNGFNILILFTHRIAKTWCDGKMSSSCYPDVDFFLWPYSLDGHTIHWSAWDPSETKIVFTSHESFHVTCSECPKISMSSSCQLQLGFFEEGCQKLFLVNLGNQVVDEIEKSQHTLNTIDCVSFLSEYRLVLWSTEGNSVIVLNTSPKYCVETEFEMVDQKIFKIMAAFFKWFFGMAMFPGQSYH